MIAYSYKGQFRGLLAELHGLLAKNGARLDMEAANVPTIAQDDSMMADVMAIGAAAGLGAVNVLDKEIEAETAKQAYKAVSHD